MFVILGAILKAVFLNITADIPSIPVDLVTSSLSSAIATQSSVIKNFSGQDVGVHGNRSSSDKGGRHVLKQLKKYWLRVVAFSLPVDASNPFSPTSVGIVAVVLFNILTAFQKTFWSGEFKFSKYFLFSSRRSPTTLFLKDLYL